MVSKKAFTIIELLIVIGIIAILSSLLLVVADVLKTQSRKAKTRSILQTCLQSLVATEKDNMGSPSPVEHPLAGSALVNSRRPKFQREKVGDLDTSRVALNTLVPEKLADDDLRKRSIQRDDRYADPMAPHLFGMERGRLRILGSTSSLVSAWRWVPDDGRAVWKAIDVDRLPIQDSPLVRYKFEGSIEQTYDPADPAQVIWEEFSDRAVATALRDGSERLTTMKAIRHCEAQRSGDPDPLILGARVREDRSPAGREVGSGSTWAPGRVDDGGQWKPWMPRGPMIVDDYGGEVLVSLDADGGFRAESAGPDRCFAVFPGADGVLATTDAFGPLLGDDRDAKADNIVVTLR